ncbi:hypothetical protein VOLCADRAFT_93702 [Volvox carteri f. nagariensis]|uniref:Uncharacterized protein n=1 Tax=Volvox carteri f. nagariensis TaxID=3068 RepID=D8U2U2_VOLCA|nr:uncharacterized protein VOLCADRAFT_93702 [Volvox carteri f. nagariensis]EFJ45865.1 hypothetical protein VOLCADRAFT_93702 [Volvox carteri f. nagariensis]|eukprot:XP_002952943.1 hypothetical protein VOLCADRAFT_93702 [Volvox carteri f. nagariensis]
MPAVSRLGFLKVPRRVISCRAKIQENMPEPLVALSSPTPRMRNGSMIRSLAAAVELNVGVAVAACIEIITDHSVFFPVNGDTAITYACVALATLASSVGIAFVRGRGDSPAAGTGVDILEAVYASLTAAQRSAASVTQAQFFHPSSTRSKGPAPKGPTKPRAQNMPVSIPIIPLFSLLFLSLLMMIRIPVNPDTGYRIRIPVNPFITLSPLCILGLHSRGGVFFIASEQVDKAVDYVLETVLEGRFDSFSIEGLMTASDEEP